MPLVSTRPSTFLSTPALRQETPSPRPRRRSKGISIHSCLAAGDVGAVPTERKVNKFLSTPALRQETGPLLQNGRLERISIHSCLAAGDRMVYARDMCSVISIHSCLAAGDRSPETLLRPSYYFYPLLPCGRRRRWQSVPGGSRPFLSTPALRQETGDRNAEVAYINISIHSCLAAGDQVLQLIRLREDISIHSCLAAGDSKSA